MKNPKAPLMKVPASAWALFKSVETSLVDRREMLNKVLEQVQANLAMVQRPYKDKRSGCLLEITRLAYNKKRAAFLDPDNAHHNATRMAVHLAIVGMNDVRTELIEAATIDGQALAERRDAYHNKQHADHARVYALVEAELERRRTEHGIPAPKPRNLVGEVITDKTSAAYLNAPTQADLQPQHDARDKAQQEIRMRYPNFNKFATEHHREQAERKQKQEAAAEEKAQKARETREKATLATLRKRTADRREGVHTATEERLQKVAAARAAARAKAHAAAEAKALAQKIREVDATDEWL